MPLVDRPDRALEPDLPQERNRAREQRSHPAREERDGQHQRPEHERAFDPEVGADVVVAEREHEADRGKGQGGRPAERPLEQHRAGHGPTALRMPAGGLVDPDRVASDRRGQHLARGVGDEVGAHEPGQPLVDSAGGQQPLPAPRHRPHREHHDRDRAEEVADVRVREDVQRLREVDLPDQVGEAEAGDDERPGEAEKSLVHAARRALRHGPCGSVRTRLRGPPTPEPAPA